MQSLILPGLFKYIPNLYAFTGVTNQSEIFGHTGILLVSVVCVHGGCVVRICLQFKYAFAGVTEYTYALPSS